MAQVRGPGSGGVFDPWDLDDVSRRVVGPVLAAVVRPADLQRADVGWGPQEGVHRAASQPPLEQDELWLLVQVKQETWHSQIWQADAAEQLQTLGDVAWSLADHLEDWLCEGPYWGEHVVADVTIPSRPAAGQAR